MVKQANEWKSERMDDNKEKCIIIISHSNYRIRSSGVEKYLSEISELIIHKKIHCIHFFPVIEVNKKYRKLGIDRFYMGINVDGEYAGIVEAKDVDRLCGEIINGFQVEGVQIHHLKGWKMDVLKDILHRIDKEIRLFIHDHMMTCPNNLESNNFAVHCNGNIHVPSAEHCVGCPDFDDAIVVYSGIKGLLKDISDKIGFVVVPSEICRDIWLQSYGYLNKNIVIRDHNKYSVYVEPYIQTECLRVALIGGISEHKGINEWKQLVNSFKGKKNIEFFYLGVGDYSDNNVKNVKVDFWDKSLPSMKDALLQNQINCVFLWSLYPETYSYTFYEAMSAGCFVLTNKRSGNICLSAGKFGNGRIFEDVSEVVDFLEDMDGALSIIREYKEKQKIPSDIMVNDSVQELLFDGGGQKFTKQNISFRYSLFWSLLYKIMRVKNYK